MQVTIVVDEALLIAAAQKAIADAFAAPTYASSSDRGALGYEVVRTQVRAYLNTIDATPYIKDTLATMLPAIVNDVLAVELRKLVKNQVKAMRDDGTLFAEGKS